MDFDDYAWWLFAVYHTLTYVIFGHWLDDSVSWQHSILAAAYIAAVYTSLRRRSRRR